MPLTSAFSSILSYALPGKGAAPRSAAAPVSEAQSSSLTARVMGRLASKRAGNRATPLPEIAAGDLKRLLVIPVSTEASEETQRSMLFERGQFLARQERWECLTQAIHDADKARSATPCGMPVAELLAQGARADVVALAEHILLDGAPDDIAPLTAAISALEEVLGEHPDNPMVASILALAHLDIAWAWRGAGTGRTVPARHLEAFDLHAARARQILDPFCGIDLDSPLVTAARCALLAGDAKAHTRVADDYEDLIDLAPAQQIHIRALGHYMLPQWYGSYQALELEARRTAARTQDIWGAGAYCWAYFDALLVDPDCAAGLDLAFFVEGMRDILSRAGDQHLANLFASYCAVSLPRARRSQTCSPQAQAMLEQIETSAHWIMSQHLHELHPLIWGHAMEGFDNHARIASLEALFQQGRRKADQVFMRLFGDQLREGNMLIFTPQGLYVQQA